MMKDHPKAEQFRRCERRLVTFAVQRGNRSAPARLLREERRDATEVHDPEDTDLASQKAIGCCAMTRERPLHPTAAS